MIDTNVGTKAGGSSPETSGSPHSSGSESGDHPTTKDALKQTAAMLSKMGLSDVMPVMADKMPGGTLAAARTTVTTNVYGVRLPSIPVFRYDVTVLAFNPRRDFELTKQTRGDYRSVERKTKCLAVFDMVRGDAFFGGQNNVLFYDGQKILYSLFKLGEADQGLLRQVLKVEGQALTGLELGDVERIELAVSDVGAEFDLSMTDVANQSNNLDHSDHSLMQFINIATSQYALFHPESHLVFGAGVSYLKKPWDAGFRQEDCPKLSEGKYVAVGAHKSAARVEGPKGRGSCNAAVIVDTAKTAFHSPENILDKSYAIVPSFGKSSVSQSQIFALRQQMRGLFAITRIHNKPGTIFEITGISTQTALDTTFMHEGASVSVARYYEMRYQLKLQYPDAPLLVNRKSPQQTNYYPMEISYILEHQRVQKNQQTAQQLKGMRSACIIAPATRLSQNNKVLDALQIMNPESAISKAGMKVIKSPLTVEARVLPAPRIMYGNNMSANVDPNKMVWSIGRNGFLVPAKLASWAAYVISSNGRDFMDEREFQAFLSKFIDIGNQHGMRISKPVDLNRVSGSVEDINRTVQVAAREGCEFILFVQSDTVTLHDAIKDAERKYEIVTQDVKMSTAMDVVKKNKWQTMENIISKTNVKMGGLNHGVVSASPNAEKWLSERRLVMGLSMSHAAPSASTKHLVPSVVGYAANTGQSPFDFIGDFGYQTARRADNVDMLGDFLSKILKTFKERRGYHPSELIVYRGGISEGEFAMAIKYEVPLIRAAAREAGCNELKITFIVANRMHNIRLIPPNVNPRDRASDQNVKPGTVVDTQLVHPVYSEFYINSHRALQGTAKTPRYTVLVDDIKLGMDELEGMTFALCFCHQIVALTTSLPTPLYIASEYADRGRRLLVQRTGVAEGMSSSNGDTGHSIDMESANKELPYYGSKLAGVRVNA